MADRFCGAELEATGEDRKAAQEHLFDREEQVETPGDGIAHRPQSNGWSRAPPVRSGQEWSSRASIAAGGRAGLSGRQFEREGNPSSRRQISVTIAALATFSANVGLDARARVTKSWTASGVGSGSTITWFSSVRRRTTRLVARIFRSGQWINR